MDRREFVVAALAGLATAGAPLPGARAEAAGLDAALQAPLLRQNVYCLKAASPALAAYAKAVQVMKTRPATDPTSWLAQANIHGAFSPPAGMIANVCRHDTRFFLSWHRMYLHFFERIARAACGDANFALPYWGYSAVGQRGVPAPFLDTASPLFDANRRATINAGGQLAASAVDAGPSLVPTGFNAFTNAIDSTPHGAVHIGVGGDMSLFETAGQDPIFWLHHANIDRLWELWLQSGGGRANPTSDSLWMTQAFNFYDETGATVSLTGAQIVDTAAQLNYRYASPLCLRVFDFRRWRLWTRVWPWDPLLVEFVKPIRSRPQPRPDPRAIANAPGPAGLGATPSELRLVVPPEARRLLAAFPAEDGTDLQLVLADIRLERPAEVFYEVYVNLPRGTAPDYTGPHYAGNVSFFGPSPDGPLRGTPLLRELSLVPVLARLRARKLWRDADIQLTFVPRSPVEGDVPVRLLRGARQATIGRVAIELR